MAFHPLGRPAGRTKPRAAQVVREDLGDVRATQRPSVIHFPSALSLGAAAAATALAGMHPASAATFTVTNLLDDDLTPPAGSLRAAIEAANSLPGLDTIVFASGLTGTILQDGDAFYIGEEVTIDGPGSALLTVQGSGDNSVFYIYHEDSTAVTSISGLAVTGGASDFGGGIAAYGASLALDDLHIFENSAAIVGGGFAILSGCDCEDEPVVRPVTLSITDSLIENNTVLYEDTAYFPFFFGHGGAGGAILGTVETTITNTVIRDNSVDTPFYYSEDDEEIVGQPSVGGGLFFFQPSSPVLLDRVTVSGNSATAGGGGIASISFPEELLPFPIELLDFLGDGAGELLLRQSVIANNEITVDVADLGPYVYILGFGGAGIAGIGSPSFTVESSLVQDNESSMAGGGASFFFVGQTTVDSSTFDGNSALAGGGLVSLAGSLTVVNSTFTANTADAEGAGESYFGGLGGGIVTGGFYVEGEEEDPATIRVDHSTFTGNSAYYGGGIAVLDGLVTVSNSIVALNSAIEDGDDVFTNDGDAEIESFYSLLYDNTGAAVTDLGGSIYGVDPLLGTLQDNGGPTLGAVIPAVDATSPTLTTKPDANGVAVDSADPAFLAGPPTTDQRGTGFDRVENLRLDRGAIEIQDTVVRFTSDQFFANEADGVATISVERTQGDGPAEVFFSTANDSAQEPADYDETSGSLTWLDNEFGIKTFDVPVVDDGVIEGDEDVFLSLELPELVPVRIISSSATTRRVDADQVTVLGDPSEATLTIQDSFQSVVEIPTLGQMGRALFAALAAAAGLAFTRRKATRQDPPAR